MSSKTFSVLGHFGPILDHNPKTGTQIKILFHYFLGHGWVNIIFIKDENHTLKTVGVGRLFPFWAISGPFWTIAQKPGPGSKFWSMIFMGLGWVNIIRKNELHTMKTVGVVRLFPFWAISGPFWTKARKPGPGSKFCSKILWALGGSTSS